MPLKDKDTTRLFFPIGEVASMFGVNTSLIRYYAEEFDVIKPHKNKKGNRLFTSKDLEYFTRIFSLIRDEGHSLAETKELMHMKASYREPTIKEELVNRLTKIRNNLQYLLKRLESGQ